MNRVYSCEWCKVGFAARVADRRRGWARFCSKVCKAKAQAKRDDPCGYRERPRQATRADAPWNAGGA
jgi:hypothetical protein